MMCGLRFQVCSEVGIGYVPNSKLQFASQDISVIALAHSLSNNFLVQVNGELRSPSYLPPPLDTTFLWAGDGRYRGRFARAAVGGAGKR